MKRFKSGFNALRVETRRFELLKAFPPYIVSSEAASIDSSLI
jgi:hypothetical protein